MTELTDEQIEKLTDKAAEKAAKKAVAEALQQMYMEIGRGVLQKAAAIVGIGLVALAIWAANHFK